MEKSKKSRGSLVGKIFKYFFLTIAVIILLIAGLILYKANKYPDKVPDVFGYKPMIVLSGSMETSIYTGDLVIVKIVDPTTLKVNDIIAFRNEEDTVTTHRIVEIVDENNSNYFKTKGDNNNAEDANLVSFDDVEGIYLFRIPRVGNFLMFMQKPIGLFMVLLIILFVGVAWLYFVNRRDEKKYLKEEEKDRLEFEEFKKMKKAQEEKEKNK